MWTCPVCDTECTNNVCTECGFDYSKDYERFATLQMIVLPSQAISALRKDYKNKHSVGVCPCCGSAMVNNHCIYCSFEPADLSSPEAVSRQSVQHALELVGNLTDFSVSAFRYVWVPERCRLEQKSVEVVKFGNANDFFNKTKWAKEKFAQMCDGEGTELNLNMIYKYKGKTKRMKVAVPTVKSDYFWHIGVSLDTSLHLKVSLGSRSKIVTSGPIALDLT